MRSSPTLSPVNRSVMLLPLAPVRPVLFLAATGAPKPAATTIAIAAFWVMDFGINSMQAPLRAISSDIFPARQQAQAGGIFALHTGIGNCESLAPPSKPQASCHHISAAAVTTSVEGWLETRRLPVG